MHFGLESKVCFLIPYYPAIKAFIRYTGLSMAKLPTIAIIRLR